MKRINLKESLLQIDKQTDFKYTLTDLYEACMLEDDDKKKLVQYVEDKDIPAMSAMLSNAAGVMSENVADDLSDDEVTLVEDDTMSLYRAANLEDIEYIMSYEMPDCIVYNGDAEGEYRCAYHNGTSVEVKFNPDAPGYVYTIDGEGPYETRSDETVKSDILRALDRKVWKEAFPEKESLDEAVNPYAGTKVYRIAQEYGFEDDTNLMKKISDDSEFQGLCAKYKDLLWSAPRAVKEIVDKYITQDKSNMIDESFKPGDVVYVKPSKKTGRVVSVNGDNVEVEVQGGNDPDRKDTYYKNDLELQDSVEEGWNPDMTDCPSCGDISFDSKKGRCTRCSYRESWFDDEDEESEYEFVSRKYVTDSDGFQTEYTWYKAPDGLNVFVFGDSDFYRPEDGNFDYEEESDHIAQQWFDSYVGFGDDDEDWVIDEGIGAVLGDLAGRAVGDTWQGVKNFAKGVKDTAKDIKTTFNTSDTVAKVKDGVRSLKGAKNVDDVKNEYQRRQEKRRTNRDTKKGVTKATGDPQDWKYVVDGKRMKYDDFMKLSVKDREKLNKEQKIKVYDVLGKQKDYSADLVERYLSEDSDAEVFYNFLDARGRSVEDMEEVEVTDDAQAIMAGKSNPQVITVTKFINGSNKPDEVLWERESDKWYVSRYIGGAEYEPAEGGYYYETLTLDDSLEFPTKEEAIEALKEIAAEYDEGELVYQDDVEARFKFGKYIGDTEELHVEREPGVHASGKQVYEALEDHEYARVDGRKLQEEFEQKSVAGEEDDELYPVNESANGLGLPVPKGWTLDTSKEENSQYNYYSDNIFASVSIYNSFDNPKQLRFITSIMDLDNPENSKNIETYTEVSDVERDWDYALLQAIYSADKIISSMRSPLNESNNDRVRHYEDMLNKCQSWEEVHDISTQIKTDPKISTDDEYNLRFEIARNFERFNESKSIDEDLSSITSLADDCGKNTFKKSARDVRFTFEDEQSASKFMNKLKEKNIHYDELPKGIIKVSKASVLDESESINESIKYPNGMSVSDIDLDKALDYQYGTDRDKNNSTYSDEEKQRAVNYWMDKTDPRPDGKSYMEEAVAPDYSPKQTGTAYKVFRVKNGKLYPPMVANPGGADTPVGVWLTAEEGEFAGVSKTGRPQVKSIGSGTLSYRPGWHLGDIPRASQFDRTNKETGEKEFPKDFVWAECDYVMDVDYQPESDEQGYMRMGKDGKPYRSDKYQHSLAGLPKLPKDGYYKYRTNPRPDTVPWVITGAIRVNKLLSDAEVNSILQSKGIEPIHRQGGDKTLAELGL